MKVQIHRQPCQVCSHPDRAAIERELMERVAAPVIGKRYGIKASRINLHAVRHIRDDLKAADAARAVANGSNILSRAEWLYDQCAAVCDRADGRKRHEAAALLKELPEEVAAKAVRLAEVMAASDDRVLRAVREARPSLELIGKLVGELRQDVAINLHLSPDFQALRRVMLWALRPYPDAQRAVAHEINRFLTDRQAAQMAATPEEVARVTRPDPAATLIDG